MNVGWPRDLAMGFAQNSDLLRAQTSALSRMGIQNELSIFLFITICAGDSPMCDPSIELLTKVRNVENLTTK